MSSGRITRLLAIAAATAAFVTSAVLVEASDERVFLLSIKDSIVPPNQRTIRVTKGDVVNVEAISDRAVVLHVHGLKLELVLKPMTAVRVRIPTRATGRFPIELHDAGAKAGSHHHKSPLAYLEVGPK